MGKLNKNNIKEIFNKMDNVAEIDYSNDEAFGINWSAKDIGFGNIVFYKTDKGWQIDNESMSKEFIKKVLGWLVDSLPLDYERNK